MNRNQADLARWRLESSVPTLRLGGPCCRRSPRPMPGLSCAARPVRTLPKTRAEVRVWPEGDGGRKHARTLGRRAVRDTYNS